MARADRFNIERKRPEIYSDFTINLDKNPLTGLLARLTNEDSVKNSIKNLCRTMRRERFNQPLTGTKAYQSQFEMNDEIAMNEIVDMLQECIRNDEPRASNVIIEARKNERNETVINCIFSMVNIPERISFSFILKRVR